MRLSLRRKVELIALIILVVNLVIIDGFLMRTNEEFQRSIRRIEYLERYIMQGYPR